MFELLMRWNGRSRNRIGRWLARQLLEKLYGCEIHCAHMDESVRFAHHARGCTIVAAKIGRNVVIYQNVTIGSNLKYNKSLARWENVGNPIISDNAVICDGAKILGPIVIGRNSVVSAGAIVTRDVPADSIAYAVNRFRRRDDNYDLVFRSEMIDPAALVEANQRLIDETERRESASTSK
jgi:serine O-acetyltransferase